MTRRFLLFACIALLPAGCGDDPRPEYTKPLAQWRQTKVATRALPTVGGPTLQVPDSPGLLCNDPEPGNDDAGCDFHLDERTGRLATLTTGYDQRLDVAMDFELGRFAHTRNEARIGADQRPASGPPLEEAAVEQALTGISGGQRFAVGCWHRLAANASGTGLTVDGPYTCTLVIDNRSLGATEVDYPAAPPARADMPVDRARLDRIVALMGAIEASFLPPGGPG